MFELGLYDTTPLSLCKTEADVDDAIRLITGGSNDYGLKARLLYDHMDITQSFTCSADDEGLTMEEEYVFACHHLININNLK